MLKIVVSFREFERRRVSVQTVLREMAIGHTLLITVTIVISHWLKAGYLISVCLIPLVPIAVISLQALVYPRRTKHKTWYIAWMAVSIPDIVGMLILRVINQLGNR